ncbi:MAG: hypothetical protein HYZ53_19385 [Planctomycetes bacterium]|nr:hypothetical protein [Planctomycetota bacterium]
MDTDREPPRRSNERARVLVGRAAGAAGGLLLLACYFLPFVQTLDGAEAPWTDLRDVVRNPKTEPRTLLMTVLLFGVGTPFGFGGVAAARIAVSGTGERAGGCWARFFRILTEAWLIVGAIQLLLQAMALLAAGPTIARGSTLLLLAFVGGWTGRLVWLREHAGYDWPNERLLLQGQIVMGVSGLAWIQGRLFRELVHGSNLRNLLVDVRYGVVLAVLASVLLVVGGIVEGSVPGRQSWGSAARLRRGPRLP